MMKIALCGKSGSGKSSVANHLHSSNGFSVARPGNICRRITFELFGAADKTTLNRVNDAMRAIDPDVWVKAALHDIPSAATNIAVDGVRFVSNEKLLRPLGYQFWLISSSPTANSARLLARGQRFGMELDGTHSGEIEFESFAFDAVLLNTGYLDELHAAVDRLL